MLKFLTDIYGQHLGQAVPKDSGSNVFQCVLEQGLKLGCTKGVQ